MHPVYLFHGDALDHVDESHAFANTVLQDQICSRRKAQSISVDFHVRRCSVHLEHGDYCEVRDGEGAGVYAETSIFTE